MTEPIQNDSYRETSGAAAHVIRELADEALARDMLDIVEDRVVGVVLAPGQALYQIDTEEYEPTPSRKTGTVRFDDHDSFVTYVDRHSLTRITTLWGSEKAGTVTAVLDDHASHLDDTTEGGAGWGQHRAVLTLQPTPDWVHWTKLDGQFVGQDLFAEHIEDGVEAIRQPDAATMLEIAQTFHAKSGVNFESSRHLSGEIQFAYEEQTSAKAGQRGTIEIPDTFLLAVAPFEGTDLFPVTARFRFRLHDGQLRLGYRLIRPDRVRREAFDAVVQQIAAASSFPVMAGTPRA